ncbi:hypothetical protein REPUB_Repub01dG0073400 [Reevesia pubescens]
MASKNTSFQLLFIFFLFSTFYYHLQVLEAAGFNSNAGCVEMERKALLKFKEGLIDPYGRLSSWDVGKDCCNWAGVACDNQTGHVFVLDLGTRYDCSSLPESLTSPYRYCKLGGTLNPSLLNLTFLKYLDLSKNNFLGISIPDFIGSLKNLKYLNLRWANFSGMVPSHIGNLSNLIYLDLDMNLFPNYLWVSDLNWLSGLSSMKYLGLGNVNLSKATPNWLQAINMLPSLLQLDMSGCELYDLPQSLPFVNFTSLQALDLSYNPFNSSIPQWLFNISTLEQFKLASCHYLTGQIPKVSKGNLCKLRILDVSANSVEGEITDFIEALSGCPNRSVETLDLSWNKLTGNLPDSLWLLRNLKSLKLFNNQLKGRLSDSLGSLRNLEELDLSYNILSGPLPKSLWNLSRLEVLDLSFNMLSGTITESIGQLTKLSRLDLYGNSGVEGIITEIHLNNLTKLYDLSLSSGNKSLAFSLRHDWVPPFSLFDIAISDCQLGPAFPSWLRTQNRTSQITLSDVGISDTIPDWLWKLSPWIFWLDLSHNQLRGKLPDSIRFSFDVGAWINLGFNNLEGSIPLWRNVTYLSLRNNFFSGPIPSNIGHEMFESRNLDLSRNLLNGSIPPSINNMRNLSFLDLSSNYLSGRIPRQWRGLQHLTAVDLSKNNLSGSIPNSLCSLPILDWLKLSSNNLSGEVSTFLGHCKVLFALDLGENQFSGTIPESIVAYPTYVYLLNLRANKLTGTIPEQICNLRNLNILDLGHNNLSGSIPTCLCSLVRLKYGRRGFTSFTPSTLEPSFFEHTELVIKGRKTEFTKIILLVNTIDLSANNLVGEIPEEITNLSALGSLNLSWNQLTGNIPENIGRLQRLEVLDLSHNNLSGPIPPSISSMSLLNQLNLSYNNLSGQIPSSNQLQTIADPSIYEGNPGLCGPPLSTHCSISHETNGFDKDNEDEDEDRSENLWIYMSAALGFIVGFWAVFGTLVIKKSIRRAYFQYLDTIKDKLSVLIAVKVARLRRRMEVERN